jgi:uncharacterized protein
LDLDSWIFKNNYHFWGVFTSFLLRIFSGPKKSIMKKQFLFITLLLSSVFATAQSDYKVVFDLTSKDSIDQQAVIRWAREIIKASPDAKVEVVMYAKGLNMVVKDRSSVADAVTQLATNKNVSFKVCAVAMKNQGIDKSQLLPGVETVPDGIYEIITKQREGWGYIKAKN